MASYTGPDENTYDIPEVQLGDTFNVWRDITNTAVYKLNKLYLYEGLSTGSITVTTSTGGTASFALAETVTTGHTFAGNVVFDGVVVFNSPTVTMNTNNITIDDYNLVLGDTAEASDVNIGYAGGGGIVLHRTNGETAEWLWKPTYLYGVTGVWQANAHIGFSGATSGLYPADGENLLVHGTGIRVDGGSTTDHGLAITLTTGGVAGITGNRSIEFSRYSPAGSTVFMEVLNGTTYGAQPYVSVHNGVNKKRIYQVDHQLGFGTPVYLDGTDYKAAQASSVSTAEVAGIVSEYIDSDNFEITFIGEIFGDFTAATNDGNSLVSGVVYYLSPFEAGKITSSMPIAPGQVHKAVLLATGSGSAIVYPYTGGVLSATQTTSVTTSLGVEIQQYNQFKVGDFVRWKGGSTSLTYGSTTGTYSKGVYVRAQANSEEEAEVAGMVIGVKDEVPASPTGINTHFTVLMDGFFSGLCLPAEFGSVASGGVYFLNSNCAGTTGAYEGATACFKSSYPTSAGMVRKPLFMSTTDDEGNFTGYLFSYRGDKIGTVGLSGSVELDNLLIRNLGSCGSVADLVFGIRDGNGTAGGTQVMRFPKNRVGSVDIGYSGTSTTGASLDVKGVIRGGDVNAQTGSVIVVSRHGTESSGNSSYPETLNVFGSKQGTGNSVIGYGVQPKKNADAYTSTTANNISRVALEVGTTSGVPGIFVKTAATNTTAIGTDVATSNLFWVDTSKACFAGGTLGVGATAPSAPVHVYKATSVGEMLRLDNNNASGYNYLSLYNSGTRKGYVGFVGSTDVMDVGNDTNGTLRFLTNATARVWIDNTGKVGIGTGSPTQLLDVRGTSPKLLAIDTSGNSSSVSVSVTGYTAAIETSGTVGVPLTFKLSGVERARITPNGTFGIGTSTPQYLLDVRGTSPVIAAYDSGGNGSRLLMAAVGGASAYIDTSGTSAVPLSIRVGGTERIGIDTSGGVNVVGTLTVNGNPVAGGMPVPVNTVSTVGQVVPLFSQRGYTVGTNPTQPNGTDLGGTSPGVFRATAPLSAGTWFVYFTGHQVSQASLGGFDGGLITMVHAKVWTVSAGNYLTFKPISTHTALTNSTCGVQYRTNTTGSNDSTTGTWTNLPTTLAASYGSTAGGPPNGTVQLGVYGAGAGTNPPTTDSIQGYAIRLS